MSYPSPISTSSALKVETRAAYYKFVTGFILLLASDGGYPPPPAATLNQTFQDILTVEGAVAQVPNRLGSESLPRELALFGDIGPNEAQKPL